MANKPTDLTNYNAVTDDDPDGSLKDTVYSGSSISEVGSRAFARFVHDVLAMCYRLVRESGESLNGTTDTQTDSQFYNGLDYKIQDMSSAEARKNARCVALCVSPWDSSQTVGPVDDDGDEFYSAAFLNGIAVFVYSEVSTFSLKVIAYDVNHKSLLGDTDVLTYSLSSDGYRPQLTVDAVNEKFIISYYTPTSFSSRFYYSSDGVTWSNVIVDTDTARPGGMTIGNVADVTTQGQMWIPAYNDANNSSYYSVDGGATWTRVAFGITTPLYKPVISAVSEDSMVWIGEEDNQGRAFFESAGWAWYDCTFSGGTMQDPIAIVFAGDRYVLLCEDYLWISSNTNYTSFTRYSLPVSLSFKFLFYADGVIGIGGASSRLYTATVDNAIEEQWAFHCYIENGSGGANKVVAAVGESVLFAGPDDLSSASTHIFNTAPLLD